MASGDVQFREGDQAVCFVSGDYSPADNGSNYKQTTPAVTAALTMSGLTDGQGRHSAKFDLGSLYGPVLRVMMSVELANSPDADGRMDVYWAPSEKSAAGEGNVEGNSGSDADAPDGTIDSGLTLAQFLRKCDWIGCLPTHDYAGVQAGFVAEFVPPSRYGQIVVVNNTGATLFATDDAENGVFLTEKIPQSQS